jgi:hypothetical protein
MFNTIIGSLDLRGIALLHRQFTWANHGGAPTYEKFDRILESVVLTLDNASFWLEINAF